MKTFSLVKATLLSLAAVSANAAPTTSTGNSSEPLALVYRGPAACQGCPEAVYNLLKSAPATKFQVEYVGPHDKKITKELLNKAAIFAQPGGGNVGTTWKYMEPYSDLIRNWVTDGGRYMGFCLGAYFIGTPGYNFMPKPDNTYQETTQPGSQVKNDSNTILQVDWTFSTGPLAGQTQEWWQFYQDGPTFRFENMPEGSKVLGHFNSNQNISALIMPFGKGYVAATGPHPEANKSWYPKKVVNPDGINFTIGWDFVETAYSYPNLVQYTHY